jgi:hypothetical protein
MKNKAKGCSFEIIVWQQLNNAQIFSATEPHRPLRFAVSNLSRKKKHVL